ncbi:dTDP-4-dehydrorhamnose reductase [Halpernia humi]|uniref:dTDP-4-dehydrorhamnose reductase n=1 Tax=Halpernia humi TaxID=493375 RepID=A0A1H6A2R4_9FLAO|nr:SDR family oxidoreductase [Halpernia humi]SEG42514.1 dTDP-4-dehydrorhamnose reductase [Halpernia humi]
MKKILVIGIKGMAGHVIFKKLQENSTYKVFGLARNIKITENTFDLDVSKTDELTKIISENNFDVIINAIGILNKDAEDHPEKAVWFNSYFPHFLEKITKNHNSKVIHISTDCVFNGKKGNYTEKDTKDGVGFYAQSKALGELENEKDLTIRTSIIGPEINKNGIGLFHWFMSVPENTTIKGFSQAFWSGLTTIELANVIEYVIENNISGLLQVAPKNKIDKYSLLNLFNEIFRNNNIKILPDDAYKVDKSLVSIREDFKYKVPTYSEMLIEMKNWINAENIYSY